MELIVDGYNVLKKAPEWRNLAKRSLADARAQLERRLATYRGKHRNVNVLVYYDGDRDVGRLGPRRVLSVSVVFTQMSADGAIIGRVRASQSPKQITVVTDDRKLASAVADSGATVISVEDLIKRLTDVKDNRRSEKPRPDTGVGKKITEDLKDVWGA